MPNHLFIVEGDVSQIRCDAWLLPSDSAGNVVSHWVHHVPLLKEVTRPSPEFGFRLRPEATSQRGEHVRQLVGHPGVWPVNTGDDEGRGIPFFQTAVSEFVKAASTHFAGNGGLPLLALPLVGTGAGGGGRYEAHLVAAIIDALLDTLESAEVHADVVLVVRGPHRLAAANAHRLARKARPAAGWLDLEPEMLAVAVELADRVRRGQLTLFVGAGVSASAGLPDWDGLIDSLVQRASLSDRISRGLRDLEMLDQATVIERGLAKEGIELEEALSSVLPRRAPALAHWILANLDVGEAATTNYDSLLEEAAVAIGRPFRRIRYEEIRAHDRWLLKLHGTLEPEPADIVLSRTHYLRFGERSAALAGLVHALLLTRHMLFIGFSLRDPNFHRIAHDVRASLGEAAERPWATHFGTAVLASDIDTLQAVWRDDLRLVGMLDAGARKAGPSAYRRSDVFLDAILAHAVDAGAFLLAERYAGVVSDADLPVREALKTLSNAIASAPRGPARDHVERVLARLGAEH